MIELVANSPPFSSMHVQCIEGGFICLVPPGMPLVARTSSDVATTVHAFLSHSGPAKGPLEPSPGFEYKWPAAAVSQGSVFHVAKTPRVKKGAFLVQGGYVVTHHTEHASRQRQLAAFNRATVMDRLKEWLTTAPASANPAVDSSALLTLAGMRINPDMDEHGDTVFMMTVQPASHVENFTTACPFVARCDDPAMVIGVVDALVVHYLAEELEGDSLGEFAVRVHEHYLEFGPRLVLKDESDYYD